MLDHVSKTVARAPTCTEGLVMDLFPVAEEGGVGAGAADLDHPLSSDIDPSNELFADLGRASGVLALVSLAPPPCMGVCVEVFTLAGE